MKQADERAPADARHMLTLLAAGDHSNASASPRWKREGSQVRNTWREQGDTPHTCQSHKEDHVARM